MPRERRERTERRAPSRVGGRRKTDIPRDWVTVTEYAWRHGVARNTVVKWIEARILRVYQVDAIVRIRNVPPDEHKFLLAAEHAGVLTDVHSCSNQQTQHATASETGDSTVDK